ncbi:ParB N-terminal domain-containing protein [Spirochaeta isovalerica]|uniref:ParB family chromosome partitioning protein n=1 Tax=Spirochaeta isovalerica TaxID=150 RepID=A0A841R5F4_9SPIO|nr:ParB N-terminal domain-containing protein [Spirochaeta isovalerica]MBB6479056.1 ParB family chromosome partitioning protein [Spirochaeta isovalerica]
MQLDINKIVINKRVRKNTGDLSQLAESMEKYGQMHPVIVNKKMELISGYRRMQCARQLNWKTVFAIVVDINSEPEKLAMELEENLRRKDFTEEEKIEAFKKLAKLSRPNFFTRLFKAIALFFKGLFKPGR